MFKKPGRNDPCSCGSGKKYKRCCLSNDEAAARETARQQALFAGDEAFDDPDVDEDDDPEEFYDIEEDAFALDVHAITRVSYTRGLVKKHRVCGVLEAAAPEALSDRRNPEAPRRPLPSSGARKRRRPRRRGPICQASCRSTAGNLARARCAEKP